MWCWSGRERWRHWLKELHGWPVLPMQSGAMAVLSWSDGEPRHAVPPPRCFTCDDEALAELLGDCPLLVSAKALKASAALRRLVSDQSITNGSTVQPISAASFAQPEVMGYLLPKAHACTHTSLHMHARAHAANRLCTPSTAHACTCKHTHTHTHTHTHMQAMHADV